MIGDYVDEHTRNDRSIITITFIHLKLTYLICKGKPFNVKDLKKLNPREVN